MKVLWGAAPKTLQSFFRSKKQLIETRKYSFGNLLVPVNVPRHIWIKIQPIFLKWVNSQMLPLGAVPENFAKKDIKLTEVTRLHIT